MHILLDNWNCDEFFACFVDVNYHIHTHITTGDFHHLIGDFHQVRDIVRIKSGDFHQADGNCDADHKWYV
jgi:hypothetical protein